MSFLSPTYQTDTYTGELSIAFWESVWPFLQEAVRWSRKELTAEAVQRAVAQEKAQLWTFRRDGEIRCVMVTELLLYAKKVSCNILVLSGKGTKQIWEEIKVYLFTWLRANHVQELQATGRKSVARHLKRLGFHEVAITMAYPIPGVLP